MLDHLDEDAAGRVFSGLELNEAVRVAVVCQVVRGYVQGRRSLNVPRSASNKLTLASLLAFNRLEELVLHGFLVDDGIAARLVRSLPRLKRLSLDLPSVSGLEVFQQLVESNECQLEHLALVRSPTLYRNNSPNTLRPWPTLRSLDVSGAMLTSSQLEAVLQCLPGLEVFKARNSQHLQVLGQNLDLCVVVPSLRSVDLSGANVADVTIKCLASLPALEALTLEGCCRLQAPVVSSASLRKLSLAKCRSLTRPRVEAPRLEDLNLFQTNVTDTVLMRILDSCWTSLRRLKLSECIELRVATKRLLARGTGRLESVDVSRTSVAFACIENMLSSCPALVSLDASAVEAPFSLSLVSPCNLRKAILDQAWTTDELLESFVAKCPGLEFLSLRFCTDVRRLPSSPSLTFLDVSATALDDAGLELLPSACPSLKMLLARSCDALHRPRLASGEIRTVSLCHCKCLEKVDITSAPSLSMLDLGSCPVFGSILEPGAALPPSLRMVNLHMPREAAFCDPSSRERQRKIREGSEAHSGSSQQVKTTLETFGVRVESTASYFHSLRSVIGDSGGGCRVSGSGVGTGSGRLGNGDAAAASAVTVGGLARGTAMERIRQMHQ
eukprot:TRINITY_DN38426_c0_g1_i1.p1 TRINITY_DN38426_c0_g1~~TRINITY_DN38426_c0_g1_i1.p1  ORF type:complete len:612 (-),score=82.12 TRINITY_DN38426_c0_g1_i1:154-1989(-)